MACMTENSETTPWSMQTEVVSTNLCHFLDNHKMEVITLQQITGKGSVQAVYKWIWGNGFPSIDAFYLICDKFSNEGIHIEDFLRKDGIPLQVEEAAAKWTKAKAERKEEEEKKKRRKEEKRRMCKLKKVGTKEANTKKASVKLVSQRKIS
ncbi:hypothetical protein [Ruminococcus sp. Marseille-P328]|uniref:hypothetical protein n=1 Tax=Ruminococcus sp. Marseille-P328 TaxID=1816688 RepID=UPI00356B12EC